MEKKALQSKSLGEFGYAFLVAFTIKLEMTLN